MAAIIGQTPAGVVTGMPNILLRVEGAALLAVAAVAWAQTAQHWWIAALLFFVPDVAMLGYLRGPRLGAALYNAAHAAMLPWVVAVAGWALGMPEMAGVGLIWLGHIGFDRAAGYGLKYPDAFGHTHLSAR